MGSPTSLLFDAALRVLAYLGSHKAVGLRYEPDDTPLAGMSDSSWEVRGTSQHVRIHLSNESMHYLVGKQETANYCSLKLRSRGRRSHRGSQRSGVP